MQTLTLREIQEIELNILSDIDRFCRENGIRYSLDGGTLLGAVRHHGFIPWDDDIDIIMPREDYDRFLKSYQSKNGQYRLYTKDTIPAYRTQMFAKVIDTQTIANEELYQQQDAYGLWVDIFPADYVPAKPRAYRRIAKRFYCYRHLLYVRCLKNATRAAKIVFLKCCISGSRTERFLRRSTDMRAARKRRRPSAVSALFVGTSGITCSRQQCLTACGTSISRGGHSSDSRHTIRI